MLTKSLSNTKLVFS